MEEARELVDMFPGGLEERIEEQGKHVKLEDTQLKQPEDSVGM
jgi:hypothetical protein